MISFHRSTKPSLLVLKCTPQTLARKVIPLSTKVRRFEEHFQSHSASFFSLLKEITRCRVTIHFSLTIQLRWLLISIEEAAYPDSVSYLHRSKTLPFNRNHASRHQPLEARFHRWHCSGILAFGKYHHLFAPACCTQKSFSAVK